MVVRLLKERGHYVRTLSRAPGRAAKLNAMADDVRLGDATGVNKFMRCYSDWQPAGLNRTSSRKRGVLSRAGIDMMIN
jgi:hypothetical protein